MNIVTLCFVITFENQSIVMNKLQTAIACIRMNIFLIFSISLSCVLADFSRCSLAVSSHTLDGA